MRGASAGKPLSRKPPSRCRNVPSRRSTVATSRRISARSRSGKRRRGRDARALPESCSSSGDLPPQHAVEDVGGDLAGGEAGDFRLGRGARTRHGLDHCHELWPRSRIRREKTSTILTVLTVGGDRAARISQLRLYCRYRKLRARIKGRARSVTRTMILDAAILDLPRTEPACCCWRRRCFAAGLSRRRADRRRWRAAAESTGPQRPAMCRRRLRGRPSGRSVARASTATRSRRGVRIWPGLDVTTACGLRGHRRAGDAGALRRGARQGGSGARALRAHLEQGEVGISRVGARQIWRPRRCRRIDARTPDFVGGAARRGCAPL